jgi:ADP-ribose pyrophosphatase YjhB (NUDIX family)
MVRAWERRYGEPVRLATTWEVSGAELAMVRASQKFGRCHDITMCISDGRRYVVIAKPTFPEGAFRIPSGGLKPGESLESGVEREAFEETGLRISLDRYLLRVDATFACETDREAWVSHVFFARALNRVLAPTDHAEIREARWATIGEIQGPIRDALVRSGRSLLGGYRVELTDALVGTLAAPTGPRRVGGDD